MSKIEYGGYVQYKFEHNGNTYGAAHYVTAECNLPQHNCFQTVKNSAEKHLSSLIEDEKD